MKEENNIDKFFQSQLKEGEAEVPAASWDAIKPKINTSPNNGMFNNRHSNKALLLCLLFGALISGIGFYTYHLQKQNDLLVELLDKDEDLINKEEELYKELLIKNELAAKTKNNSRTNKSEEYPLVGSNLQDNHKNLGRTKVSQQSPLATNNAPHKANSVVDGKHVDNNARLNGPKNSSENHGTSLIYEANKLENNTENRIDYKQQLARTIKNRQGPPAATSNNTAIANSPLNAIVDKNLAQLTLSKDNGNMSADLVPSSNSEAKENLNISNSSQFEEVKSSEKIEEKILANPSQDAAKNRASDVNKNVIKESIVVQDANSLMPLEHDSVKESSYSSSGPQTDSITLKKEDSVVINKPTQRLAPKDLKNKQAFTIANSIEFFVSPEVSYRSVSYSNTPLSETAKAYKENDRTKFTYSGGVLFNREISKRLYIQTGILYSNFGDQNKSTFELKSYDTTYTKNTIGGDLTTSGNTGKGAVPAQAFSVNSYSKLNEYQSYDSSNTPIVTQNWVNNTDSKMLYKLQIKESVTNVGLHVKNSINYVGVPLVIGTNIGTQKWRFGIFSGLITNLLISPAKVTAYSYTETKSTGQEVVSRNIDLNRFNFVYWGGIDLTYNINEKWSFRVAPTMKRFMNSIYKDSDVVKQMPYSYGVQVGFKYNFNAF
ncbi:MAG TPA: hypothetical protein VF691_12325 [Cytophagaceae bacterium]|jgi:hypothetical protein